MSGKTEAVLVAEFEKHIYKKYGPETFFYNVHESAYGKCGMPDVIVKFKKATHTIYVEVKRHSTILEAITNLRPTQIGTITELLIAEAQVFLLYAKGCAAGGLYSIYKKKKLAWNERAEDDMPFNAFDCLVSNNILSAKE